MRRLFKAALFGLALATLTGAAVSAQPYWRHRHHVAVYPYYGYAPYAGYGYGYGYGYSYGGGGIGMSRGSEQGGGQ